jgi:hypothetical protein
MKLTIGILFAATLMMSFSLESAGAQTIYSQDFTIGSGITLHGSTPTLANSFAGGSSGATWNVLSNSATAFINKDGSIGGNQNTALLAFTPQSGNVYTLSATLNFTAAPGSWLALGFATRNPAQNAGSAKLTDNSATGPGGVAWMIANDATGNNEQFFAGPGAVPGAGIGNAQALMSGPGTFTLTLDLDTRGSQWSISSFIDGVQLGTNFVYTSNPTITAVGIGENTLGTPGNAKFDTFDLSVTTVPEPSPLALTGVGAAMLMLVRRKSRV